VEAFHSRRAQEAEATIATSPSIQTVPAPSSNNTTTPTITPPKRNLSTKDTDSEKDVGDESGDDQPKPRKSRIYVSNSKLIFFAAKKRRVAPSTANIRKSKTTVTIVTDDDMDGEDEVDRESSLLNCM
jgi:hypothetical protein